MFPRPMILFLAAVAASCAHTRPEDFSIAEHQTGVAREIRIQAREMFGHQPAVAL